MRRRDVIAALAAAAVGLRPRSAAPATRVPDRLGPLGLQLYTVRELMRQDVERTLAAVAAIGIREVEFAGYFGRRPADLGRTLGGLGLTAPAAHVPFAAIGPSWSRTLDDASAVGHRYVVIAWIDAARRRTLDDWRRIAEAYVGAAEQARAAGLGFAVHNHDYEFQRVEGRMPFDVVAEATEPALVRFELDLYWIRKGGQDALAYFRRWPGRFPMVHVKDMTADGGMADVGAGAMDWRAIFARRAEAGIRHYFIEHDEPADPLASVRASHDYLVRLDV